MTRYFVCVKDDDGKWCMTVQKTGICYPKYTTPEQREYSSDRHLTISLYFNTKIEADLCCEYENEENPDKEYKVFEGTVSEKIDIPRECQ